MSANQPVTVVGYDGSLPADRALEYAIDRLGPGSLCIVHAWQPPAMLRGAEVYPAVAATSLARAEALLEDLPNRHPRLGEVAWVARLAEGHPCAAIERAARETAAAEIVVGTHGHSRVRGVLGSTAHALLHDSPCPVTVVPPRALIVTA
jgi:nucleotide-binding universal stress UspA family protein